MIYCPECGSEVAPIDSFCQYCGIALTPVNVEDTPISTPIVKEKTGEAYSNSFDKTAEEIVIPTTENEVVSILDNEVSLSNDQFPATPLVLTDDYQPPVAHLDELLPPENREKIEAIAEDIPIEEREICVLPEDPLHVQEPNTESVEEKAEETVAEVPILSEEPIAEVPFAEKPTVESVDVKTEETVAEAPFLEEQPVEEAPVLEVAPAAEVPFLTEETPIEIEVGDDSDIVVEEIKVEAKEEIVAEIPENIIDEAGENAVDDEIVEKVADGVSDEIFPEPINEVAEVREAVTAAETVESESNIPVPVLDEDPAQFEATLPYVPDAAQNKLEFSNSEITALDGLTEYKGGIEVNKPYTENALEKTTPPNSDYGLFPQTEISVPPNFESVPETPVSLTDGGGISSELVENKPVDALEAPTLLSNSAELSNLAPPIVVPVVSIPSEQTPESNQPKSGEIVSDGGGSFTNPISGDKADTDGKSKQKLKPLEEGTVLNNRYEIVRKIGGGGMGAVYLAKDNNLGGILRAVKEMVQSYIEETQQDKAIADFKRESLLLTSLEHSSIPTIFDYFFDDKEARFYLVMKYISGGDLAGKMRASQEGRVDEVAVTDWAIQTADVLEYLHRHDPPIVYRDLKPSNIMLDGNSNKVMLIDFGIARWVNKEEKGVTAVGTMGYAPPELFSGNVEPRSDIYSLGSTMFHLLTGADPQSNPLLIFDFNKNPRPRQINSQLTDQIEQIVMRAVEYNADQRFTSAAEMRDALKTHLENLKKGAVTFGVSVPTPGMPFTGNLPVFCGFCGQKILATDMFCPFCGAQQPLAGGQAQNVPNQATYSAPRVTSRLVIIGTNDLEHTEFNLEKDSNLIGRRDPMSNIFPEVDLSKYDPQTKISRKHARIWRENDGFMLEDLGSSNGTILILGTTNNSIRLLPRQPHKLSSGDKIRAGDTNLLFTVG